LICSVKFCRQRTHLVFELFPTLLAFLATSAIFISVDTIYYSSFLPVTLNGTSTGSHFLSSIKLTPLNLLRYNLSTSNLSLHGIHPRWLHFVVNLPMVVGVSAFGVCIISLKRLVNLERKKTKKGGSPLEGLVDDCMQRGESDAIILRLSF
jgi:Alg9-like mannosyltransferase family